MIEAQIKENILYSITEKAHREYDDFVEGELTKRIEKFPFYNLISDFDIKNLDLNEWNIIDKLVIEYSDSISRYGIENMPPILISDNNSIIDGIHRLNSLKKLGYSKVPVFQGTHNTALQTQLKFKKTIKDEYLKIHRISCYFGHIDIMEDAEFSPEQNSVSEFMVNEHFRGMGYGDKILKEALNQYDNLGAQISSLSSLKVFINNGFTGFNGETDFSSLKKEFEENCGSIFTKINKVKPKNKIKNKFR